MAKIQTSKGTMEAKAWHVGKHVAADLSGGNWRIDGKDVDRVIEALSYEGTWDLPPFHSNECITIKTEPHQTAIIVKYSGIIETILTPQGRDDFLAILQSVAERQGGIEDLWWEDQRTRNGVITLEQAIARYGEGSA